MTQPAGPKVALREVVKHFRKPDSEVYPALGPVSIEIGAGELVAIVGPSGCGKSTLLRAVAGLDPPTAGVVELDGSPVRGVSRSLGFLFQDDALLPWRTVEENISLGLRLRKVPEKEVRARTAEWIAKSASAASPSTTRRSSPAE